MEFEDLTICFGGELEHGVDFRKLFQMAECEWNSSGGTCWEQHPDPVTGHTCMRKWGHKGPHCCDYNREGIARVWLQDFSMGLNRDKLDVWTKTRKPRPKVKRLV